MSEREWLDFANYPVAFADCIKIERHGAVSHLLFATSQNSQDGHTVHQHICARVIVSNELLPEIVAAVNAKPHILGKRGERLVLN
jgi:hypothetical protein